MSFDRWLPYIALAFAAATNLYSFVVTDSWIRWGNLVTALVMVWAGWRVHQNRRILDQQTRDFHEQMYR